MPVAPVPGSRVPEQDLPAEAERRALEELAVDLAVRAGAFIRRERPEAVRVSATKTTDLDIVTAMDTGSEKLLREHLARARPDDGILGEEEGLLAGRTGLSWVLDPIDGTVNYLYELPAYAVSVAVVAGDPSVPGAWRPVAGAVASPAVGEVFHARAGGGAWWRALGRDGSPEPGPGSRLQVVEPADLGEALTGTGFGYDRDKRHRQGRVAAEVLPRVRDLRRMGSASLDLCSVAAGRLDAYYEWGLQPWDLAAGLLVAVEAGAVVSGLGGAPAGESMVVAGPPRVHGQLHDLLDGLGAGQ